MEPHKELSGVEEFRPHLSDGPELYFQKALAFTKKYYQSEMDAIASVKFNEVTPEFFFREYTWVVHATGFSAKAVGKFMPRLLEKYGSWDKMAMEPFDDMFERVILVCNNPQKAKAIHKTSRLLKSEIYSHGWEEFKNKKLSTPKMLADLPYIGGITCFHLGRNIGLLECVKPDLHLVRMADHWGFKDCVEMCEKVRPEGMPLGIVDLCFWYSASTWGTIEIRKEGSR